MSEMIGRKLTGRCASGAQADAGKLAHAVLGASYRYSKALCGAKPGRLSSGWGDQTHTVTCPRCIKKLAKQTPGVSPS